MLTKPNLLSQLVSSLQRSWDRDTSINFNAWSPENPALGQCTVTALVVNDYLGGTIIRTEAILPNGKTVSHYFNLVDGEEIDLTRSQFPSGTIFTDYQIMRNGQPTRDYALSFPETTRRYNLLKNRVNNLLRRNKSLR